MRKTISALAVLAVLGSAPLAAQSANMSFFITSAGPGDGARAAAPARAEVRRRGGRVGAASPKEQTVPASAVAEAVGAGG